VNDYRVAAFPLRHGQVVGQLPDGTNHAYLKGGKTTACGFGLRQMHLFESLRFSQRPPSARCRLCARIVGASDH
jgi:hypothetical protein